MKTKSFFSLLAGLAAGAALGVLYAPDKGSNTRARVKKAAEDGLGDFGEKAAAKEEEAEKSLKSLKETLREKGNEIKEGTRQLLLEQLDRLENALRKVDEPAEPLEEEDEPADVAEESQEEDDL